MTSAPKFDVSFGDMFTYDWHDADMIFANSTCFNNPMMENLYEQSLKCKKGTFFLTMSKKLPYAEVVSEGNTPKESLQWEHVHAIKLQMSWGKATINIQRKLTHP